MNATCEPPRTAYEHNRIAEFDFRNEYSELHHLAVRVRFQKFAAAWKKEKIFCSSMTDIEESLNYKAIINLGIDAIPLILHELETDPDFWFGAHTSITGEDPVLKADRGNLDKMTVHWLTWGIRNGFNQ